MLIGVSAALFSNIPEEVRHAGLKQKDVRGADSKRVGLCAVAGVGGRSGGPGGGGIVGRFVRDLSALEKGQSA